MLRVIGRARRLGSRAENPHPRRRRVGNRKLSRPRIAPGRGSPRYPRFSLNPSYPLAVLCIRGDARGDSSRYSLLMGVLFSGVPGPPETCHASLSPRRVSRRTMLDTDNAARTSKIQPEVRESHVCAFRFPLRALAAYDRAQRQPDERACESRMW